MNPMFKTSMCHSMMNEGHCDRGMMCKYAHSPAEIRGPGGPTPPMSMHGNTNIMVQGFCPRGETCGFAHSAKQLLEAQARDPKYKTAICETWKANGSCDRGSNCIYAHGQSDLRQKSQMPMQNMPMQNMSPMTTAYPPQYSGLPANQMASQQTQNPRWKTSMCIAFAKNGFCTKMAACQYAHGPQELRGATTMPQTNMMGQSR